jgi:hypothetical protein
MQGKDSIYMTGFAQERVTNLKDRNVIAMRGLSDKWSPPAVQPSNPLFYLDNGGRIIDNKFAGNVPQNINAPAGTLFTVHQDLQVYILDPCRKWMGPYPLGHDYEVTVTKNPDNTYKNTHVATVPK